MREKSGNHVKDVRSRAKSALYATAGSLIGILVYAELFAAISVLPYLAAYVAGFALIAAFVGAAFPSLRPLASVSIGFLVAVACSFALTIFALSHI